MKTILSFFSNIFKISNIGTIIFFIINLSILFAVFSPLLENGIEGYLILLLIYLFSLVLSFSPIGQAFLCLINGAKKMRRLDMRERIFPIVDEVYLAAKKKTPSLPNKLKIRVMYDPNPNAFAIGINTICITEGLLDLPENLIAGVVAHEIGHLALNHTIIQVLIGGGNLVMSSIIWSLELMRLILSVFSVTETLRKDDPWHWLGAGIAAISAGVIYCWTKICLLILMGSNRANEYAADKYAFEIGYGDDLAEVLDRLTMGTPHSTFLKILSSSHPEPSDRIARLQSMGATYSRY